MSCAKGMAIAAAVAAVLLTGCSKSETARRAESPSAPLKVTLATVEMTAVADDFEATGTVRARVTATLSARMMAQVREVRVQSGDRVTAGQTLVVLDARDVEVAQRQAEQALNEARGALPETESGIGAAKAQLTLAQSTFKRMQDLFEKKSITAQEFDEAQARLRLAEAQHEMARTKKTQLESRIRQAEESVAQASVTKTYTVLAAPFAGLVIERKAEPGVLAAPGVPLLVIEQAGAFRLEAAVEESRLASLRVGQPATVELDAAARPIETRIGEIVPMADPVTRTVVVKLDLPGIPNLRSGLYGKVRFRLGERRVLTAPAASVREQGQMRTVYVADNGVARARFVTLGAHAGDRVEVLSGLQAQEKVVSPLPEGIADGSALEVRP